VTQTGSDPDQYLSGRVALITGASRGIGRAIAVQLARRGATLACVATSAERAQETVAECTALGARAQAYGVDVGKTEAVIGLVAQVQQELGGLDLLVNNAGITRDGLLLRMSEQDFDSVIETNLKGTWNFVRAASRALMKSHGRIVNISSVVGLTGNAGQVNYAASKAGLVGLARSIARELASRNITANVVAPGFVATDMASAVSDERRQQILAQVPAGRYGEVDEIAAAVTFLASDAAGYISGAILPVDGGLGMGH